MTLELEPKIPSSLSPCPHSLFSIASSLVSLTASCFSSLFFEIHEIHLARLALSFLFPLHPLLLKYLSTTSAATLAPHFLKSLHLSLHLSSSLSSLSSSLSSLPLFLKHLNAASDTSLSLSLSLSLSFPLFLPHVYMTIAFAARLLLQGLLP